MSQEAATSNKPSRQNCLKEHSNQQQALKTELSQGTQHPATSPQDRIVSRNTAISNSLMMTAWFFNATPDVVVQT